MAYTPPTFDEFTARFPVFAAFDEDLFDLLLAEAMLHVDETWIEKFYAPALLYLVAHLAAAGGSVGNVAGGAIASESFGPISIAYVTSSTPFQGQVLATTGYGQSFLDLRRKNFPAIKVC